MTRSLIVEHTAWRKSRLHQSLLVIMLRSELSATTAL
jgi:hypothetical protein